MIEIDSVPCPRCKFRMRIGTQDLDAGSVVCLECRKRFSVEKTDRGIVLKRTEEIVEEEVLPLGLPKGSVRALVAIILCAAAWASLLRGVVVPEALRDILFTVLAYYFARRSVGGIAGSPGHRAGDVDTPLHLPTGSVRFFLMAGFAIVAVIAVRKDAPIPQDNVVLLAVVGGFLVGQVLRSVLPRTGGGAVALLAHGKALAALAATIAYGGPIVVGRGDDVLPERAVWVCVSLIGFYFGSR